MQYKYSVLFDILDSPTFQFNPAFIKDNDSLSSEDLVDVALLRRSSPPKRTLKKSPSRDSKHSFNHSSSTSTVTPMHSDAEVSGTTFSVLYLKLFFHVNF